jgi:hypothetical protein
MKILREPGYAGNGIAKLELGRDSRRNNVVHGSKTLAKTITHGNQIFSKRTQ